MENTPYFPPLYGYIDCGQCENNSSCVNAWRHQRNRRDFPYTSGRCPRLPEWRGFVSPEEREMYAATFPLVHAERSGEDVLYLTLTLPGTRRKRTIYHTKKYWYIKEKNPEYNSTMKRVVSIEGQDSEKDILEYMERFNTDYCVFRCVIEDYYA